MIPQTAEYALRAAVWLASCPGEARTSEQIAEGTRVPPRYLYKVLQALTHAGLLVSQPGPGGGFSLAKRTEEITILDVVNAVGPMQRIQSCPLKLESHDPELCPLHHELDTAYAQIEEAFSRVTIGQLLKRPSSVTPFCGTETS